MNRLLFGFILLILSDSAYPASADVFVYFRTSCYGTCPAFEVSVFSDGVIVFNGEAYTEKEGIFYCRMMQTYSAKL